MAAPVTLTSEHQPVMGTHLALQVTAPTEAEAQAAVDATVADARRLEARFTVFDPASELCRWRSGAGGEPGPELVALLGLAAQWQARSGGAFNPMAGVLTRRWLQAVIDGVPPAPGELAGLAASIAAPRFSVRGGEVARTGPCDEVDLNAIAKGHVVDLVAVAVLDAHPVERLVVNAGGDLVHRGAGVLRVAVEDPLRPYDNVPPLLRIEVADAAVATSGRARRWFDVGGERRSRVLDPRTGWPVDNSASATVVAPDAATADVLATVASVLAPPDATAFVDGLGHEGIDAACLVVDRAGGLHRSERWGALEV